MALSKLAEKCRKCPFVDKCDNKRMEALAVLLPATQPLANNMAMPMAREVVERHAYGQIYTQYKDELEREIQKSLLSHFDIRLKYGG